MKSLRVSPLILALAVLLLASLACAQLSSPPTPTVAPAATVPPATAVPTAAPTNTPEPTKAPEPTPTATPELGKLVLDEKFADNSNNWYLTKDKDVEVTLADGKYTMRILAQDYYSWSDAPVSISDVDLTFDTEFIEGAPENAAYGLMCHYKDADNWYRLRISPDGMYAIDKQVNKEKVVYLVDWKSTSALKQGSGVVNQVHAICSEDHLTLFVNDILLADVTDTSLSGGSFALMTGSYLVKKEDKNPIGVNFSNLVARKPLAWERPTEKLLTDGFDDNKNDWDVYKDDLASAQVENGQMVISVIDPDSTYVVTPGLSLSNVDLSFDAVVAEGTPANTSFGAACRRVDGDNRYMFDISADGQYYLGKRVLGKSEKIVAWTTSNAIKTGAGDVNHVRVICSGSTLELYVNDQLLISTQDESLTAGGFALQAGRFKEDDKPVSVGFDNLEVLYPQP
jgi:hypothetical protein